MNEIGVLLESNIKNMRQFYGERSPYVNCQPLYDDLDVNVVGLVIADGNSPADSWRYKFE